MAKLNEVDGVGLLALKSLTGSGVILVTSHTRGTVVEDHNGAGRFVISHIYKRVDTGVKEGGVTDNGNPILYVILALCLFHTVESGNAGTHANGGVNYSERSNSAEGVATDVARRVNAKLFKHGEYASVGATGAENGRTRGSILLFEYNVIFAKNCRFKHVNAIFTLTGKALLALNREAPSSDLLFNNGLKLLKNVNGLDLGNEILNKLLGNGVNETEL